MATAVAKQEPDDDSPPDEELQILLRACIDQIAKKPNVEWVKFHELIISLASGPQGKYSCDHFGLFMNYVDQNCHLVREIIEWTNSPFGPRYGPPLTNKDIRHIPVDIHFEPGTQVFLREEYQRHPDHTKDSLHELVETSLQLRGDRVHSSVERKTRQVWRWWNVWATTHGHRRDQPAPLFIEFDEKEIKLIEGLYRLNVGFLPSMQEHELICSNIWCYEYDRIYYQMTMEDMKYTKCESMLSIIAENQSHCIVWINKYFDGEPLNTERLKMLHVGNFIANRNRQKYQNEKRDQRYSSDPAFKSATDESAQTTGLASLQSLHHSHDLLKQVNESQMAARKTFDHHYNLQNEQIAKIDVHKLTRQQRMYFDNLLHFDMYLGSLVKVCHDKMEEYYDAYVLTSSDTKALAGDNAAALEPVMNMNRTTIPRPSDVKIKEPPKHPKDLARAKPKMKIRPRPMPGPYE